MCVKEKNMETKYIIHSFISHKLVKYMSGFKISCCAVLRKCACGVRVDTTAVEGVWWLN